MSTIRQYNVILLLVAGLGGLLYGIDVGIIASALPYLSATSGLDAAELSMVVAAVLLGSVLSTLFAGTLADWFGRKKLMIISGVLFALSIPIIALAQGYGPLLGGRLLQGISAGLIGVVVPLYLAECLTPAQRGAGTGVFQWLLTLGIFVAAIIGIVFSMRLDTLMEHGTASKIFSYKNSAWRDIFWASLPPSLLFIVGSIWVAESPRWLFKRGRTDAARAALLRSRTPEMAQTELAEMQHLTHPESALAIAKPKGSLLQKKYIVPFVLACVILACNQATGINSIIGYNTAILLQAGLSDLQAHWGYVSFAGVNFLMTIVGVLLVDRIGRKWLLSIGSFGIMVSLVGVGWLFYQSELHRVDCRSAVARLVQQHKKSAIELTPQLAASWMRQSMQGKAGILSYPTGRPVSLVVIYSVGKFSAQTPAIRSDSRTPGTININRADCLPDNAVRAFFANPFASFGRAQKDPLVIDHAWLTPVPTAAHGWLTLVALLVFASFYAAGPGVCVWLALSELMPTRIRSNGMSIALVLNQGVSTIIAATFLPLVGTWGYAMIFFGFAACTIVYFVAAAFFLPETRKKTLEEIEMIFQGEH
ncbi:MAG: MFS transporter [Phycisphaerales bacterium]|nr:MFS transporter [Phycisphaerales bacterium]